MLECLSKLLELQRKYCISIVPVLLFLFRQVQQSDRDRQKHRIDESSPWYTHDNC